MELAIAGEANQTFEANDAVFNCPYNEGLVHQIVTAYMAKGRAGTSAQKTRSEVRGGGAKPWRQKGTGRARAGTIRSPIWRSGGVTFASKTRNYTQKVNKKMYRKGICSILSELNRQGSLIILEDIVCESNKTKDLVAYIKSLNVDDALIISHEITESLYLASRNLINIDVTDTTAIDPVTLLRHKKIIVSKQAIKQLEESLA